MIDFQDISMSASLPDLATKAGISLKQNGREYQGLCLFHSEKTPSFQIYPSRKGGWNFVCQGCGAKGNAIDFMCEAYGIKPKEAAKLISGENVEVNRNPAKQPNPMKDPYAGLQIGRPGEDAQLLFSGKKTPEIWNPKRGRWSNYTPSMVHTYSDKHDNLIGYVIRVDLEDGKKMTPQVFWTLNTQTDEEHWSHFPHPTPRPLYLLPDVYTHPDRQVLIVEGEKSADAAKRILGDKLVCVSWMGGAQAVRKTYWKSLAGRSCILWHDNDEPGKLAMFAVSEGLKAVGAKIKKIDIQAGDIPEGIEHRGFDIADAECMGKEWISDLIRRRIRVIAE